MSVQCGVHAQIVFFSQFGAYCIAIAHIRIVYEPVIHDIKQRGATYLNVKLRLVETTVKNVSHVFAACEIGDFRQRQRRIQLERRYVATVANSHLEQNKK